MPLMMKVDFEPYHDTPFDVAFQFPMGLPGVVECTFSAGTLVGNRLFRAWFGDTPSGVRARPHDVERALGQH